jgi:hypothetical protein
VYHNVTAGINVEGNSTGATIENNVSVDNGINSPRTRGDIRVDGTANASVVLNYNHTYLSVPGTLYTWGSTQYSSLAALRAAVPAVEANGIQADPLWASVPPASYGLPVGPGPSATDFELTAGSPAIDAADPAFAPQCDAKNRNRVGNPDRGALEFQGTSGPPCQSATVASAHLARARARR